MARYAARVAKLIQKKVQQKTAAVARDVLTGVVSATPEDTSHAIGNWQVGLGSAPTGEIGGTDPGGTSAIASGIATIAGSKFPQPIHIANNVDYLAQLVAGSSDQAPADFVNNEVQKVVRKHKR